MKLKSNNKTYTCPQVSPDANLSIADLLPILVAASDVISRQSAEE